MLILRIESYTNLFDLNPTCAIPHNVVDQCNIAARIIAKMIACDLLICCLLEPFCNYFCCCVINRLSPQANFYPVEQHGTIFKRVRVLQD